MSDATAFTSELCAYLQKFRIDDLAQAAKALPTSTRRSRSLIATWRNGSKVPTREQLVVVLLAAKNVDRARQGLEPRTKLDPRHDRDLIALLRTFDKLGHAGVARATANPAPFRARFNPLTTLPHHHVERPHHTTAIADVLTPGRHIALTGPTGVGKTTLALHTYNQRDEPVKLWLTANTLPTLIDSYARAAAAVKAPGHGNSSVDKRADAFRRWMHDTTHPWFIVLDDVTPDTLTPDWWPPTTGTVLTTTRLRSTAVHQHHHVVHPVGPLTVDEARALIRLHIPTGTTPTWDNDGDIDRLAQHLDHLPDHLSKAAAYLIDTGEPLDDFLTTLPTLSLDTSDSLNRAWVDTLSATSRSATDQLAGPLLELCALGAPTGVPELLLTHPAVLEYFSSRNEATPRGQHDPLALLTAWKPTTAYQRRVPTSDQIFHAIRDLHKRSLLTHNPGDPLGGSLHIDRIQRHTLLANLDESDTVEATRALATALNHHILDNLPNNAMGYLTLDNAHHVTTTYQEALWLPSMHPLLANYGWALNDLGKAEQAQAAIESLLLQATQRLGPHHPDTIFTRRRLITTTTASTSPEKVLAACQILHVDAGKHLGLLHPETLHAQALLGLAHCSTGNLDEGISLMDEALKHLASQEHNPVSLYMQRVSAETCRANAGRIDEAVTGLLKISDEASRTGIGVATQMRLNHALCAALDLKGHHQQAAERMSDVLTHMSTYRGETHPATLNARHSHAGFVHDAGRHAEAQRLLEGIAADAHISLDSSHYLHTRIRETQRKWRAHPSSVEETRPLA